MCAGVCLSSEVHEYSAHTAVISAVREYLLRALHGHFPVIAQDINHCIDNNVCVCVFYGGVPTGVASLNGSDVSDGKCVTSEGFPSICVLSVRVCA